MLGESGSQIPAAKNEVGITASLLGAWGQGITGVGSSLWLSPRDCLFSPVIKTLKVKYSIDGIMD